LLQGPTFINIPALLQKGSKGLEASKEAGAEKRMDVLNKKIWTWMLSHSLNRRVGAIKLTKEKGSGT